MLAIWRLHNVLVIIQANGAALNINMSLADFEGLMAAAAPSSWVTVTDTMIGSILLNTFTIAYIYEVS
jgi:hypothetical protein